MNATLRNLLVASSIAMGMIFTPYAEAQVSRPAPTRSTNSSRNDRNNNNSGNHPGNSNGNKRPSNPGNSGNRPGNSGNHNGNRPGSSNGNNNRPGNSGNRPGNSGNHNGNRPGYGKPSNPGGNHGGVSHWPGYRPPSNPAPSVRPVHNHNWSVPMPPPHRHYRPVGRPIPRPVPPHGYHPCHTAPVIRTILGITFGTLYNASLDYLYNKGYEIDGYADNTVYLRNVPELGYTWPDATIYYDCYGRMASSQFIYSTSFSATGRYDRLYHTLSLTYGTPVSATWNGSHRETIWYGGDARGYVSLEYDYSAGRYYTILSYGI